MRLRRRQHCYIEIDDQPALDVAAFFRGDVAWRDTPAIALLCPLLGARIPLDAEELRLLAQCPAGTWVELEELLEATGTTPAQWQALVDRQVLLADTPAGAALQRLEHSARGMGWSPLALLYHRMTAWHGVAGSEASREHSATAEQDRLTAHVAKYGLPPPAFVQCPQARHVEYLTPPASGELDGLLARRSTTRAFDAERPLDPASLSRVLFAAFGARGTRRLPSAMLAVKKGSPSGGGLHPVEAYVLLARVEGMASGLYHYRVDVHALELLLPLAEAEVREWVCTAAAGQAYFAEAHVAVLHVARFGRHFWKYVEHHKAYKAILMDSAHVSQTLYLAATELGLGAYYTAAINDADIDAWLGLDGIAESCIAMSGFGHPDPRRNALHFIAEPYDPVTARADSV